jgi:hypothetical protein
MVGISLLISRNYEGHGTKEINRPFNLAVPLSAAGDRIFCFFSKALQVVPTTGLTILSCKKYARLKLAQNFCC